ncbi:hypothetical protein BYT27DRAFT_7184520 [Phlegmacium glaucopus]|nr:hypothetical protein BYT27DRAFT_7184520 [Phlegmacium glaucopus]
MSFKLRNDTNLNQRRFEFPSFMSNVHLMYKDTERVIMMGQSHRDLSSPPDYPVVTELVLWLTLIAGNALLYLGQCKPLSRPTARYMGGSS